MLELGWWQEGPNHSENTQSHTETRGVFLTLHLYTHCDGGRTSSSRLLLTRTMVSSTGKHCSKPSAIRLQWREVEGGRAGGREVEGGRGENREWEGERELSMILTQSRESLTEGPHAPVNEYHSQPTTLCCY